MDADITARLARGEVLVTTERVPGSKNPRLWVRAVIDAPPDEVWPLIDRGRNYDQFMPRIKSSTELSRNGDVVRQRTTVDMPFPLKNLTATTTAVHTVVPGERYIREWKLESGDYRVNEGRWTLTPFGDAGARTYAEYQILVVPKIPIPKKVASGVQERAMPKMIQALRDAVSSSSR